MRCLVTGVAGFIGSHLAERLLADGQEVVGLDAFHPYYGRDLKEQNLSALRDHAAFRLVEADLRTDSLRDALENVEVVFHEAAMPGLLRSWDWFDEYMTCNILATQRLLEAARQTRPRVFVHASTSSVYGRVSSCDENALPQPTSPYGATKLCAEKLTTAYWESFDLPVVVVRYFSVYGPRQRPDMGYSIVMDRILRGETVTIFGDGEQTRGNTFITDCVEATVRAAEHGRLGEIYNVGGGEARSMNWVVAKLQEILGREASIVYGPPRPGEQREALAVTNRARDTLGWSPRVGLEEGLRAQADWRMQALGLER